MSLIGIFFSGLYFENIFIWHTIGLGTIVLFNYTLSEAFWVSIRFVFFLLLQTAILVLIRPWFDMVGRELFLLITLIGCEMILSIFMDMFLPKSHLEDTMIGFIRRGDSILPLVLSVIIAKQYPPTETIVYSAGLGLGFVIVLCAITAISINFNFNRLHPRHCFALKLIILGIISIISY